MKDLIGSKSPQKKTQAMCPLCESHKYLLLAKSGRLYSARHGGTSGIHMRTVLCRECALVYRHPMPKISEMNAYYQQGYYEDYKKIENRGIGSNLARMRQCKKRDYENYIENGIDFNGKKILDVGAGRGLFLEAIKNASKPEFLFGFEPSSRVVDWITKHMDFPFSVECYDLDGFLESKSTGKLLGGYDIIIFNGVLEHLPNPKSALNKLHRLLKNDGFLLIKVPNEEPRPWFDFSKRISFVHLLYFTVETLNCLFDSCGYEHVQCANVNNSSHLLSIIRPKNFTSSFRKPHSNYHIVRLFFQYLIGVYFTKSMISFRLYMSRTLRHYLGDHIVDLIRKRKTGQTRIAI